MKEYTQELPEFIQGLATKKSESKQRREIVKNEYNKLLDSLGRKNGKNKLFVHNDFLNVDVWFVNREGGKETSKNSVHNWQSAYAVLHLETIVRKAEAKEGKPIYCQAKTSGNQVDFGYVNMAVLYYDFIDTEKWYLNFTVKLVLGVKTSGRHVHYSITKIGIIE